MTEFEAVIASVMSSIESPIPVLGERWRHFKGGEYEILGIVFDADGKHLVPRVLYSSGTLTMFSRTLANFLGPVGFSPTLRFVKINA